MQKCYNIMITGMVQDIGFRALIENIAKLYELRGFTFNYVDGSVKMVCTGENGVITDFLEQIDARGVSTSNLRVKMIATENTEATEYFLSVFSVLSVADNTNNDSYRFYCHIF